MNSLDHIWLYVFIWFEKVSANDQFRAIYISCYSLPHVEGKNKVSGRDEEKRCRKRREWVAQLTFACSITPINMYSALYRYLQENIPQNRNKLKNPLFFYFFVKQEAQHPRKKRNEGKRNKASSDQKAPGWNVLYSYPWTGNVWSASHGLWKVRKWLCLENIFYEWFQRDVSSYCPSENLHLFCLFFMNISCVERIKEVVRQCTRVINQPPPPHFMNVYG